jgi:membrane protein required for beta-lactamase induction
MDWSLSRIAIVSLAVIGGGFAMLSSWCQARGDASKASVRRWNIISYACMAASMILFIGIGFYNFIGART